LPDLVYRAAQYGTTPEKRSAQQQARAELDARGAEGLRALMERVHLENVTVRMLAEQAVDKLDGAAAAPVLLEFLDSPRAETRKFAAYFLGNHRTPEHWERLAPLLTDEEAGGAAIRALGKWGVTNAVPLLVPLLRDVKERRRVSAANALRDIGDPSALLPLVAALGDPVFTVRNTALRAVIAFGAAAEPALLDALPSAGPPARRQIIRALGEVGGVDAAERLRGCLDDPDEEVRADAKLALARIEPAPP
jgi:HEAT repeat protein